MTSINPYLNFDGQAEEAMNFYKSVFGGEFPGGIMRWGDMPSGEGEEHMKLGEEHKNKVMHMALPISDGSVIMASDSIAGFGPPLAAGNNVTLAIGPDSREEADRIFAALSEGGEVQMPMSDAFWGGYFGAFVDKFGINWLVNVDERERQ